MSQCNLRNRNKMKDRKEKKKRKKHVDYRMMRNIQRVPVNIQDIPVSSLSSRRIVLLGRTGVGKSAAGNTILGQKVFVSNSGSISVTHKCSVEHTTVSGRSVSVVDTPPFFDTCIKHEQSMTEIGKSISLSSPGPHAFLIVCRVNIRFTEEDRKVIQWIKMLFGEEVLQ